MKITYAEEGWGEYLYWQTQDENMENPVHSAGESMKPIV